MPSCDARVTACSSPISGPPTAPGSTAPRSGNNSSPVVTRSAWARRSSSSKCRDGTRSGRGPHRHPEPQCGPPHHAVGRHRADLPLLPPGHPGRVGVDEPGHHSKAPLHAPPGASRSARRARAAPASAEPPASALPEGGPAAGARGAHLRPGRRADHRALTGLRCLHARGHLHVAAARPPVPAQRPALGRGPRLDERDVRQFRADHAGRAARQGGPAPDRLHRLRGFPLTVLRSGSASDVGRVRTVNQDLPLERPNLYAVADGMGGHVGGEVAARVAVETLDQAFEREPTVDGLREAFSEANAAVWHESQSNSDLRGMGTTLTAVALVGGPEGRDVLALANVGDSRAYVLSAGEMTQVTDDHSLAEERMRHGEMTEEEAAVHPQRHILTRALGVASEVEADMWDLRLRSGDRVLLCSDGLTNEVGSDEIADILREVDDPEQAAQELVDAANGHGGADNITVVVVDVQVGEEGDGATAKG